MKKARFGVLFFGMGLSMTRGKHMNSAALLTLAAELNAFTKFVAMPMRGHGNVTGGDVIMRWTTGYPFGVNLCRGYPRFNPGEFSTIDLLIRGDCDAALVLGADPGATMPQPAIDHLARIPTIVLDPKVTHTSRIARVHFTTAVTGISAPGTVYRMDEIPLPLRPALKSPYPTDEEVVRRIYQAVAAKPPLTAARDAEVDGRVEEATAKMKRRSRCAATPCFGSPAGRSTTPPTASTAKSRTSASATAASSPTSRAAAPSTRTGMVVFPGGVDVHTHVAGAALNFARAMIPEDHRRNAPFVRTPTRRGGIGGATPTTYVTGYLYAGLGYTTVNEAAVPILSARHTHEELRDTPIVDKSCCVLMANNEILLDLIEDGELERARHVVAWNIWAAKAYGVKAVNPGGVAAWKWGKDAKGLFEPVARLQQGDAGEDHLGPGRHRGRAWACRTRCTCTATTSARPATSTRRWRR